MRLNFLWLNSAYTMLALLNSPLKRLWIILQSVHVNYPYCTAHRLCKAQCERTDLKSGKHNARPGIVEKTVSVSESKVNKSVIPKIHETSLFFVSVDSCYFSFIQCQKQESILYFIFYLRECLFRFAFDFCLSKIIV